MTAVDDVTHDVSDELNFNESTYFETHYPAGQLGALLRLANRSNATFESCRQSVALNRYAQLDDRRELHGTAEYLGQIRDGQPVGKHV